MNILNKLRFFGKKSDLKLPENAAILLEDMVLNRHELFNAYKSYVYAKMTSLARRLVTANKEEVEVLQAKIKILDETIKDLENIAKFSIEESEPNKLGLTPEDILKKLVGDKKEKVASEKRDGYTTEDYMSSKDFNGIFR